MNILSNGCYILIINWGRRIMKTNLIMSIKPFGTSVQSEMAVLRGSAYLLTEFLIHIIKSQNTDIRILCSQEKGSLFFSIITTKGVKFIALFDKYYIHSNTVSMTAEILFSVFTTLFITHRSHLAPNIVFTTVCFGISVSRELTISSSIDISYTVKFIICLEELNSLDIMLF